MTADVDDMAFNTAISQLMVYSNHLQAPVNPTPNPNPSPNTKLSLNDPMAQ